MFELFKTIEFTPFLLSFKLAAITTAILFVIGVFLAWYLSQMISKSKPILEAISALPIVLPPSVLGFYILYALSFNSPIGAFFTNILVLKWSLILRG